MTEQVAEIVQAVAEKKRPGRPKKQQVETAGVVYSGLQDKPKSASNSMELVYENPILFKKIGVLYASYKADTIELMFDPKSLRMTANDHTKISTIISTIDGKCTNFYYCKEPMRLCIRCEHLDSVLSKITKVHSTITFIHKEEDRSKLTCLLHNQDQEKITAYDIPLVAITDPADAETLDDTAYPLRFELPVAEFKECVGTKHSNTITFEKRGSDPIRLVYEKVGNFGCVSQYANNQKIKLTTVLTDHDIFCARVPVKQLQSLSAKCIGTTVTVALHNTKPASFTTYGESRHGSPVAKISVFTKLK